MRRREFITVLGSVGATGPLAARAQQPGMPVIGYVSVNSADAGEDRARAFRKGLNEVGYIDGQNVTVEYHWLNGQYDQLPSLMAELVRSRVTVISVAFSNPAALAAKA